MKLKLIKFPIAAVDDDLTIGQWYDCVEPYEGSDHYDVIDDAGDEHEVEKVCFETMEEDSTEWSDEGLPPVGTVCEVFIPGRSIWTSVEVVAHVNDLALFRNGTGGIFHGFPSDHFRPIKSEKEKEIDKISSELLESVNKNGEDFRHLEWEIAEHLYNAGLRFTKESK